MKDLKIINIILLIIITIKKSTEKLLIYKNNETVLPISNCIDFILEKYFTSMGKISIRYSPKFEATITNLLQKINFPVFINVEETIQIHGINRRIPDEVNIILDESTDKTKFLNRTFWTSNTQFIIPITTATDQIMINIFEQFWAHDIANVIILASDETDINIYTFKPYNRYNCRVHRPILLAKWSLGEMKIYKKIIDKERVNNLNGCTLNISVVNIPPSVIFPTEDSWNGTEFLYGIEATVFSEMAKYLNFKTMFAEPPDRQQWGWVLPQPFGAVGQVYKRKSQMAFGSIAISIERYEYLDISIPTNCIIECISWAVPVGAKKTQATWIRLLATEFSFSVWYSMLAAFLFTVVAILFLSKNSKADRYDFNENSKAILFTFRASLGSYVKVPKSLPLKIAAMTWIWYSMIISSLYLSSMGSKLTVPFHPEDINNFEELLETDLEFKGLFSTFRLMREGYLTDELKAVLARSEETLYTMGEAIDRIVNEKNLAYAREATTFMYNVERTPKAKGLVHYMKECMHNFWAIIVLPKNSILTAKVNRAIRKLFEAGLTCKWRRDYLQNAPQPPPTVVQLTLAHLRGCFVVFLMGSIVAFLVFLAELSYSMFMRCKSSTKVRRFYD